jgi:hypothetical protein
MELNRLFLFTEPPGHSPTGRCAVNHSELGAFMDARRRSSGEKWSYRMGKVIALTLIASGLPAHADTTVCYGNVCTVTSSDGSTKKMTASEVDEKARGNALKNIRNIDCGVADDAAECLKAKLTLQRLFY